MSKLLLKCIVIYFILGGCFQVKSQLTFSINDPPVPNQCTELLNLFAENTANFTLCSIVNARPIKFCERCVDQYVRFHNKYEELMTTVINGTSCKSIYISKDRLDIVMDYYNGALSVWNKGNCNTCFDWSSGTPTLSNNTINFNKMFNVTMDCILTNYNDNSSDICQQCMHSYVKLDGYYNSLSSDAVGIESICMDIVDSMNATRSLWSKTFNCCRIRNSPEIIFLCSTAIISLLPLLFYISVRYCGPIKDLPNVLKQSRFKQTFLRSTN